MLRKADPTCAGLIIIHVHADQDLPNTICGIHILLIILLFVKNPVMNI